MGQYYRPVILEDDKKTIKAAATAWAFDNGAKLMEHSYERNSLVTALYEYLTDNPSRIVWAGDYADAEDGTEEGMNLYAFANRLAEGEIESKTFKDIDNMGFSGKYGQYLINHDTKQYISIEARIIPNKFVISALPLLTCEGNGRGGGDYSGTNMRRVGKWARNLIEVSDTLPDGYKELKIKFKTDWC